MKIRQLLVFFLKLAVTAGLFVLLFSVVDVRTVFTTALSIPPWALLVAALSYIAATFIATVRWSVLLRVQGIRMSLSSLFAYNVSYAFYSMVLPGGKVSAEALRIYQILRDSGNPEMREKIFLPTLLDRLMMVIASAVVALTYFMFHAHDMQSALPGWFPYAASGVVLLVLASIFFPFERLIMLGFKVGTIQKASMFASVGRAIEAYRGHLPAVGGAFLASLAVNLCLAFAFYTIAASIGVRPGFLLVFEILSVGMMAAVLPVTIGGIGAREGVVAYLLSAASGISIETCVTISLVTLATSLVMVASGAFVEFYRNFIRHERA